MKTFAGVIITVIALMLLTVNAAAEWRVEVESKQVGQGRQNVIVNISGAWDGSLQNISIPLVVREIDPGAFWQGGPKGLPFDTTVWSPGNPEIRFSNRVAWNWPGPIGPAFWGFIPRPGCTTPDNAYDGISPDKLHFFAHWTVGFSPATENLAFLQIEFDVTDIPGQFEIDTTCSTEGVPAVFMIEGVFPIVDHGPTGTNDAVFNKGIITIVPCACGVWGDLSGDGLINPLDLPYVVNYTYKSIPFPNPLPTGCGAAQGDWNCDGAVTPLDVINLVNYVYRSYPCGPCDPCVE